MGTEPSDKLPVLLTAKEVAASLRLHEATVVRFARSGILPAMKVGREWRFRAEDVQEWLDIRNETPEEVAQRTGEILDRISADLKAAGITEEDALRVVEEVRRERRARGQKAPSRA